MILATVDGVHPDDEEVILVAEFDGPVLVQLCWPI